MGYNNYNENSFFDKVEGGEGDSPIYVGISYLKIVAQQLNDIRMAMKQALMNHELLWLWLHELRTFYALVESRTGLNFSGEEIEAIEYIFKDMKLIQQPIKIRESEKYIHWFNEIQKMLERNFNVVKTGGVSPYLEKKYLNNKLIIAELEECFRAIMIDANKKHLIMPEGQKDMKALAKSEWIDRSPKKEF
jgi:hypothetical protein